MEWIFSIADIHATAVDFWKYAGNKKIIAFHGEMGAGKTTFIKALCVAKEVKDMVSSPTFSIINEYHSTSGIMYHMDLFRLNSSREAVEAGIEECFYSGNTCLVEWPQKAKSLFPEDTLYARILVIDEETRRMAIVDN